MTTPLDAGLRDEMIAWRHELHRYLKLGFEDNFEVVIQGVGLAPCLVCDGTRQIQMQKNEMICGSAIPERRRYAGTAGAAFGGPGDQSGGG